MPAAFAALADFFRRRAFFKGRRAAPYISLRVVCFMSSCDARREECSCFYGVLSVLRKFGLLCCFVGSGRPGGLFGADFEHFQPLCAVFSLLARWRMEIFAFSGLQCRIFCLQRSEFGTRGLFQRVRRSQVRCSQRADWRAGGTPRCHTNGKRTGERCKAPGGALVARLPRSRRGRRASSGQGAPFENMGCGRGIGRTSECGSAI